MNAALHRILKSAYRKEPISSFILLVGAVDVAISGANGSGSLFAFGTGTIAIAIAIRWWQIHHAPTSNPETASEYVLPPSSARSSLPNLKSGNKYPRS
ncbi:MAG: hypothetical protein SWY16_03115 [Cyanobacteriota bacterium]|nr:hypothetical protein [Cyanobacteriota bacterium]